MSRGSLQDGFSLLELLVVLAIMSLLAVAIFPATNHSRRAVELKSAAGRLVAHLNLVRSTAIQRSVDLSLHIDPRSRRYWADGIVSPVKLGAGLSMSVAGFDSAAAQSTEISFRPSGTAGAGLISLFSRADSLRVEIEVDPLSGLSRLKSR